MALGEISDWVVDGFSQESLTDSSISDELLADYIRVGFAVARLLISPDDWINRQVDTVDFLSHEGCRRRTSIDFSLPPDFREDLKLGGQLIVPLTTLRKKELQQFDLCDESGRAVPKLGLIEGSNLTQVMLICLAGQVWEGSDPSDDVYLTAEGDFWPIAGRGVHPGRAALDHLQMAAEGGDPWRKALVDHPIFWRLARELAESFVLYAAIPDEGVDRRLIKFSYDDPYEFDPPWPSKSELARPLQLFRQLWRRALRPDRRWYQFECPGADRGKSFHLDIAIPPELRIREVALADMSSGRGTPNFLGATAAFNVNRASLYLPTEDPANPRDIVAFASVTSEKGGRLRRAAWTSAVVAGLLWAGYILHPDGSAETTWNADAAVSTVLVGAALFSGFSAFVDQSQILVSTHASIFRWLSVSALSALCASAALAFSETGSDPRWIWLVCALVASMALLRLAWSLFRAPSRYEKPNRLD